MIVPELFAARLILGCVFLASSLGKFRSLRTFADEILDYQLLSSQQARIVAYLLPFVELAVGIFTIIGFSLTIVSIVAIFLLLIFTGAIAINLLRGRHFSCHCFGSFSAMIGPATIARNILLAALAFWMFLYAPVASLNSLAALWRSDIQLFTRLDSIVPLAGTIVLSLIVLFLLGEIDTLLHNSRTELT